MGIEGLVESNAVDFSRVELKMWTVAENQS